MRPILFKSYKEKKQTQWLTSDYNYNKFCETVRLVQNAIYDDKIDVPKANFHLAKYIMDIYQVPFNDEHFIYDSNHWRHCVEVIENKKQNWWFVIHCIFSSNPELPPVNKLAFTYYVDDLLEYAKML